jgi:hypothetical protein
MLKNSWLSHQCPSAAKAEVDLATPTARLEAAPFQTAIDTAFFGSREALLRADF